MRKMGEQHQAAPSEYQILNALKEVILNGKEAISENRSKKKARKVLDRIAEMSSIPIEGLVISDENASREIRTNFYSTESTLNSQRNVVLVRCIGKENENTSKWRKQIDQGLVSCFSKEGDTINKGHNHRAIHRCWGSCHLYATVLLSRSHPH